ncbi:hypothetical protein [Streptomyces sp. x-80]|uniref:hypothetical protein n=1 Tax=Streptomyces sp. x-80 TaxID=2789282 RepID=UPI00397FB5BD
MRVRHALAPILATAALISGTVLTTAPAHAASVDVWTTYTSISECKSDLLHLNNLCFGLMDGTALGLIDAGLTVDEADQALGVPYDDERPLPAPESATNPVVEVWNNSDIYAFIAEGPAEAEEAAGATIYSVAPHTDATGPAVDCFGFLRRYRRKANQVFVAKPGETEANASYPTTTY